MTKELEREIAEMIRDALSLAQRSAVASGREDISAADLQHSLDYLDEKIDQ